MNLCLTCSSERHPAAKPGNCVSCFVKLNRAKHDQEWKTKLDSLNYDIVEFNILQGSHSKITVLNRDCGHTFTAKINNIMCRRTICGVCGPTKRMQNALKFYVEKYGRTYNLQSWFDYCDYVRVLSEKAYRENYTAINPDGLKRGRIEVNPDCAHLDHIIPIIYGFKNGLAPEILADARNLRIVPARKNLSKKQVLTEEAEELLYFLQS